MSAVPGEEDGDRPWLRVVMSPEELKMFLRTAKLAVGIATGEVPIINLAQPQAGELVELDQPPVDLEAPWQQASLTAAASDLVRLYQFAKLRPPHTIGWLTPRSREREEPDVEYRERKSWISGIYADGGIQRVGGALLAFASEGGIAAQLLHTTDPEALIGDPAVAVSAQQDIQQYLESHRGWVS